MNIKLKYLVISLVATTFIGCGSGGSGESSNDESTEPTSSIDSQNSTNSSSEESNQSISQTLSQFKLEAWADNWFAAYLGERLIIEDSVSITTEKSFNSETETFEGTYPLYLNFIIKDFKENDTGLEYIGQANQQIGDGGFIMQITDLGRGKVIAVSDEKMQCKVIHKAPLDKACANEANPIAGEGSCLYSSEDEPSDWKSSSFDYGSWTSAKVYSEDDVRPKDGYDNITWDADAKLIWSSDLELDNTLLCTLTVEEPKESVNDTSSEDSKCQKVMNSVSQAGFNDVTVTCDDTYAYIGSDTYPNHDKMNGITGTNEQVPVPALNYAAPIRLEPTGTTNRITIDAALGVAVNGVPIYDYSSQGELDVTNYDPNIDTFLLGQLDNCGGHSGRGDDYHYHVRPTCMIESMLNSADDTVIGWAYDGYPIYDLKNPDGTAIKSGELDLCNGQEDDTFGYRYHTSLTAPYVPQCLRGYVDESALPRVAPMNGRTVGTPPQGGVEGLTFSEKDGVVRMDYTHNSENYYIQYTASDRANCYLFETKTVTEGGKITTGEFCR